MKRQPREAQPFVTPDTPPREIFWNLGTTAALRYITYSCDDERPAETENDAYRT